MEEVKKLMDKYISCLMELNEEIQVTEDKKVFNNNLDEINVCTNQINNILSEYRVNEVLKVKE